MYNVQADSASVHMAMRILGVAITESALIQYSYARKPTKWTTRMSVITWMMYAIYNVAMVLLPGRLDDVMPGGWPVLGNQIWAVASLAIVYALSQIRTIEDVSQVENWSTSMNIGMVGRCIGAVTLACMPVAMLGYYYPESNWGELTHEMMIMINANLALSCLATMLHWLVVAEWGNDHHKTHLLYASVVWLALWAWVLTIGEGERVKAGLSYEASAGWLLYSCASAGTLYLEIYGDKQKQN